MNIDNETQEKFTEQKEDVNCNVNHEMRNLRGIEDEGDCGYFSLRPKFLKYVNNPTGYMFVFGMFLVIQAMLVNGYTIVIISTLETRFRLTSFETGLIVVSYDVAHFILCLFVTFYGNRGHRPRMMGIGATIFGLGCFIFAIPHFTTGLYVYQGNESDLCDPNHETLCKPEDDAENLDAYFYLFVFTQLLQGFGCIPLYSVGFTILEDSLPTAKSALFVGIANALTVVGPVIGYVVGGTAVAVYVDFDTVDASELNIEPSDPGWVGAWWVGYLIVAALAWILVAPFAFAFPKQLPGSAVVRSMRESEVHFNAGEEITEKEEFGKSMKDMPTAMCAMFRNSAFVFATLACCSEAFIMAAYAAFLPKFIENQFGLTAGEAAFYAGVIAIPGGVLGVLLSAIIIRKMDLKTPGLLKMCIIVCVIVLLMVPTGILHCATPIVAGVNIGYRNTSFTTENASLTVHCNSECECQEEYFSPVCGADGITYFSACFAGCAKGLPGVYRSYRNCSCITGLEGGGAEATNGLCEEHCVYLAPYLGVFFFVIMFSSMVATPAILVIMRCVPETQKTFAVGLQWWFVRGLGTIPGPIVFGIIFDVTCVLWQKSTCGDQRGSCYIHDTKGVAMYTMVAAAACKGTSVILFSIALYVYKPSSQRAKEERKFPSKDFKLENKFPILDSSDARETAKPSSESSDYELVTTEF